MKTISSRRCVLCKAILPHGFTGHYCSQCRRSRAGAFTLSVLQAHGTLPYIAEQRAQGATWREIGEALGYPRPDRFASYIHSTNEWRDFVSEPES